VLVVNPEDLLDTQKTLVVPTLYLNLLTEGKVSASKSSGMFSGSNNTARASASYRVAGLDKAYAQQLAQAAYDDLVAQLRQAGYTVLTYADVKDREVVRAAQRDSEAGPLGLPTGSEAGNSFVTVAPSDEQLFRSGFAGGAFSEFQSGGKSRFTDATLIIPHFSFQAPQAWAEGNAGYKAGFGRGQRGRGHEHAVGTCALDGAAQVAHDARHPWRGHQGAGDQRH
jgi:hypothetical protein